MATKLAINALRERADRYGMGVHISSPDGRRRYRYWKRLFKPVKIRVRK